jgi:polysaccharide biosynthesis protein PslH
MKILFLTNKVPYPPKDGGSIATFSMIKAFANAGHAVTVVSMNTRKHHITPFEIPKQISSQIIFHLIEVPALVTIKGTLQNFLFSKLPYNAERFIDENYRHKLELLLSTHQYDIIQMEGLYLLPYFNTIRKCSSAKIVYRSHNIEHEIWERTASQAKGIKKIYLYNLSQRLQKFEISLINQYDLLIPITQRDEKKLNELGNAKPALTIPAGIDIQDKEPVVKSLRNDLFFIGALDWTPNQEGLIWFLDNCWGEIKRKCPKVLLSVAGRNAPDWFIKILKKHQITYVGEVPNAYQFMKKHGVMIAPLLSGGGMRVKIIEGMSLKKPIVTTPIGCEGIEAENEIDIFIAETPKSYIDYTVRLVKDISLQTSISTNCYKFVRENYSNERLSARLIDFYKTHIQ